MRPTTRFDDPALDDVEDALVYLNTRPCHGLTRKVVKFKKAEPGCIKDSQEVHYWVTVEGLKAHPIPLRVEQLPARPKKKELKKLIEGKIIPTVLLYAKDSFDTIKRKVSKCLQIGLSQIARIAAAIKRKNIEVPVTNLIRAEDVEVRRRRRRKPMLYQKVFCGRPNFC